MIYRSSLMWVEEALEFYRKMAKRASVSNSLLIFLVQSCLYSSILSEVKWNCLFVHVFFEFLGVFITDTEIAEYLRTETSIKRMPGVGHLEILDTQPFLSIIFQKAIEKFEINFSTRLNAIIKLFGCNMDGKLTRKWSFLPNVRSSVQVVNISNNSNRLTRSIYSCTLTRT